VRLRKISGEFGKLGGFLAFQRICNEWLGCKEVIRFYAYESIHCFNDTIHYESIHFDSETRVNRFKKNYEYPF